MWFVLSITALLMQTTRRSTEKRVAKNIDSMALTWIQQAAGMPFIIISLFLAKFYWPDQLPVHFWQLMAIYAIGSSIDVYCYFKAITIADISYVAPLLSLVAVGNIAGAYFVLGQTPTGMGVLGAFMIMSGAYLINLAKRRQKVDVRNSQIALVLVLISVVVRSYYSNIEVNMLRVSNPTTFNFYSSLVSIPLILFVTALVLRQRRDHHADYWQKLETGVRNHLWPLAIIGLTYTLNLLATFQAKLLSPNAGYVGAIKSASVLPIVLIGIFFFKERVSPMQWVGVAFIVGGLVTIGIN
ncbi:MAG: hypothetical protein JWO41_229 [Candidatus Saccharibacteria bacterium]|nr:hypothetical protein [Candidatus Saccharibacteria bacterium]